MKRVLILDTETTGVDPLEHAVIEVAVCLFDLELACPIASFATILAAFANEAEAINGIPVALLERGGVHHVWEKVEEMASFADAFVAHFADFDRGFVASKFPAATQLPWVCSANDIDWPRPAGSLSLLALALSHGVGVVSAHRALADVDTLARLLARAHELTPGCLAPMMMRGTRPKAKFQALVSFDEKDLAKAAKFQWDGGTKRWTRTMAIEDAGKLSFPTRQVM